MTVKIIAVWGTLELNAVTPKCWISIPLRRIVCVTEDENFISAVIFLDNGAVVRCDLVGSEAGGGQNRRHIDLATSLEWAERAYNPVMDR